VNAVSPGPISTLVWQAGLAGSQVPAGRFGTPSEIAQAVVFLASDESAFTVGSELLVDGGMSL
jgi:NAD(P)-dependent dehydrogenase (short-subunit alcohol dehydrogenase family)